MITIIFKQFKIFWSIIISDIIYMMDYFQRCKIPTYHFLQTIKAAFSLLKKEWLNSQDLLTADYKHKKSTLSLAVIIIALLVCVSSVFAGLPNQSELDKYCIGVKFKIDNQIHWFSIYSMSFTDEGFSIRWGKYGENYTFYNKDQILDFENAQKEYKEKKK